MKSRFTQTDLLLLLIVFLWGVNFSVVKGAISGAEAPFSPAAFTALRFGIAALTLLILLSRSREELPRSRRDWLVIMTLGLLGNTVYQALFIVGLSYSSPASSALIVASTPVIVAVIGALLRIEKLSLAAWAGIGLSFAGVVVVVLGNGSITTGAGVDRSLLGDLMVFGSTTAWAVYTILAAPLLKRYSATLVTSLSLAIGTVPLVLLGLPELSRQDLSAVPFSGWAAGIFSGMLVLAFGYSVWNYGVQRLGGARTAVYSNLIPIVAAIVAWLARGDALTIFHLLGAIVILTGINLTRIGRQVRVEPLPAEE